MSEPEKVTIYEVFVEKPPGWFRKIGNGPWESVSLAPYNGILPVVWHKPGAHVEQRESWMVEREASRKFPHVTSPEYARGYAAGSADMRENIAEFVEEGGIVEFSEELLKLAAAIRSLPGSPATDLNTDMPDEITMPRHVMWAELKRLRALPGSPKEEK